MTSSDTTALPKIVSPADWQAARQSLLAREKAMTRALDALAAERRRRPMVRIERDYRLEGPAGTARLIDLFAGRGQLILYHFMFGPAVEGWPDAGCPGCSFFADQVGDLRRLQARDVSFALVSGAPLANIRRYKARMGWDLPWFSSAGTSFNRDFGVASDAGEGFGLSVLLRDGDQVYRTYFTAGRGVEMLGSA